MVFHKKLIDVLYGESPVSERFDIYGENELKGVLRGDFGTCFHQSELHFIAMLDSKKLTELVDHFHVERYINPLVDEDVQNVADNIVVCCYNRKDTCRYCRSTFSHMLRTRLINQKLCSFVNGRFATNIFARAYDEIPVEFYAFAKETTEL